MPRLLLLLALVVVARARMAYELPHDVDLFLRSELQYSFSCENLPYGYYADVENNCQLFHVCYPVTDEIGALIETAHFTFICNNQTVFSQDSLTCVFQGDEFPCDQAPTLYELSNAEFFRIPEEPVEFVEK